MKAYFKIIFTAFWLLSFSISSVFAQTIESFKVKAKYPYLENYLVMTPEEGIENLEGVLILLPGFGQAAKTIFEESELPYEAAKRNILTVMIPFGRKLYADKETQNHLNTVIKDVKKNYHFDSTKVVLGGFSAGGTVGLRYVELCRESPSQYPILPSAAFAVDSPTDLFEIWNYFQRELVKNYSPAGVGEANYVSQLMKNELGGTPKENPKSYYYHSPFVGEADSLLNAKYLLEIPVRAYHDVDVVWQLRERRRSVRDNNYYTTSMLINKLLLHGNQEAEFIQSKEKGVRSNGMRHTHSWSVVDETECIEWVLKSFNKPIFYQEHEQLAGSLSLSADNSLSVPRHKKGYTLILPKETKTIKGVVLTINDKEFDKKNTPINQLIYPQATQNKLAVLHISSGEPLDFLENKQRLEVIYEVLKNALEKHQLTQQPIFILGQNLSGTRGLRFMSYLNKKNETIYKRVRGIAIFDSALDMVRMWEESQKAMKDNYAESSVGEAKWLTYLLEQKISKGNKDNKKMLEDYSPYSHSKDTTESLKYLKNKIVWAYSEPDVNWWINNKAKGYYDMNAPDMAGLITELRLLENYDTELFIINKLERQGRRNPTFTWEQVDKERLIRMILLNLL
ncbi:hypothetical protein WAF17_19770 [Bernardetia sp. ABR2-2B]|uniref:hypothetical protein n=1 Tax=Bernardetia sp. ABR2-2B TaxID=3127472 RepID=UPI0030D295A0